MIRPMTDEERQRAKERAMANKEQRDEEARMSELNSYEEGLAIDLAKAQARIKELEADRRKTYEALLKVTRIHDEVEAKLEKAVKALRGWIEFANAEGMPVLLSDLEAAELTGGKDE